MWRSENNVSRLCNFRLENCDRITEFFLVAAVSWASTWANHKGGSDGQNCGNRGHTVATFSCAGPLVISGMLSVKTFRNARVNGSLNLLEPKTWHYIFMYTIYKTQHELLCRLISGIVGRALPPRSWMTVLFGRLRFHSVGRAIPPCPQVHGASDLFQTVYLCINAYLGQMVAELFNSVLEA